jgi:subfamily B ATP-binding cassette protein MsbA
MLVIDGKTTPGALFAFITAFVSAYRPFKSLVSLNVNLQEGLAAAKRIFHILDVKPTICDLPDAIDLDHLLDNNIIFHDTELKFGNKYALKSINLTIQSGKITAIVGGSGSGKTSLANLLVRFYDPTAGSIMIGNYNSRKITLASLRKQIALVTQDTMLFDSSAQDNISYSQPHATKEDIIKAAQGADAHGFITKLPLGYDTIIGIDGSTLSGGQRQRISIARAFLKNAPILILDEATSALDQRCEQIILKSLLESRRNKTTLLITHRLSNLDFVDNIIVMKMGRVVEQGTHYDLLDLKGEYYKLYHKEIDH